MTDSEFRLTADKCAEVLYRALTEIRAMTWDWQPGNEKWIEELSDITHNLPRFITGRDDYAIVGLRESLVAYVRRRWPQTPPELTEYVRIFDMTEAEFAQQYRQPPVSWPEPAVAATAN
ncbi:MAG: hypothetical protein ACRC7O_09905 [Fimbriiglobus sp.]